MHEKNNTMELKTKAIETNKIKCGTMQILCTVPFCLSFKKRQLTLSFFLAYLKHKD